MAAELSTRFNAAVANAGFIGPGDTVLVAYSGGPDSTALLHLLLELKNEIPFKVVVAHFNHKLRRAADGDERFVRAAARSFGLRAVVGRRKVQSFARAKKLNVEEAARILRYEFLEKAAAKIGATKIATGHTLDDQAETVLMRLIRGSGTRGLSGIRPVLGGRVIRPLLGFRRREVEAYLRQKKLPFRTDKTNFDTRLLRNKIRYHLIPYLERNFEPNIVPILGRTAAILADEDAALDRATRNKEKKLVGEKGGVPALNAEALAREPRGLARRLVRLFVQRLRGDLRRVAFEDVEAVLALAEGGERTLPGGRRLRRTRGMIVPVSKPVSCPPFAYSWSGKRPVEIPEAGLTLVGKNLGKTSGPVPAFDDRRRCYCDAAALRFPLVVRSRLAGDRYRPVGAPGRKKLNELLREKGVPAEERDRVPVVCSATDIIWAPGLPVAEMFKVRPDTRTLFRIEIGK
jgi:tRNA(Ile)-lysidine synthase